MEEVLISFEHVSDVSTLSNGNKKLNACRRNRNKGKNYEIDRCPLCGHNKLKISKTCIRCVGSNFDRMPNDPSEEEIENLTKEIRQGWSKHELRSRLVTKPLQMQMIKCYARLINV